MVDSIGLDADLHWFRLVRIKSCNVNRNGYNFKPATEISNYGDKLIDYWYSAEAGLRNTVMAVL